MRLAVSTVSAVSTLTTRPTSPAAVPTNTTTVTTATTVLPSTTTIPTTAHAGARPHTSSSGRVSTEAIVLGAIAIVLLLACAAWALARSRAYEPHWLLSLRHAMAEAGYRMSATWAEFADWARLGR